MGGRQEAGPTGGVDAPDLHEDLDVVGAPDAVDAELKQMVSGVKTVDTHEGALKLFYQHYPERNPHELGRNGLARATSRLRELEFDD